MEGRFHEKFHSSLTNLIISLVNIGIKISIH